MLDVLKLLGYQIRGENRPTLVQMLWAACDLRPVQGRFASELKQLK